LRELKALGVDIKKIRRDYTKELEEESWGDESDDVEELIGEESEEAEELEYEWDIEGKEDGDRDIEME